MLDDIFQQLLKEPDAKFNVGRVIKFDTITRLGTLRSKLGFKAPIGLSIELDDEVLILTFPGHAIALSILDRPTNSIILPPMDGSESLPEKPEPI